MGAQRIQYQIVGRYMDGKEVTGYHLQSLENGKAGRYNKEQVAFLVGRDQVTNCEGQIYKDKLLLRGKGVSLENLPVQQEDGRLTRTDNIGKIRKGTAGSDAMTQVLIVGVIVNGRNNLGYMVQNAGGGRATLPREELLSLAKQGRVGNARVQNFNGNVILKGVNCDLTKLPKIQQANS